MSFAINRPSARRTALLGVASVMSLAWGTGAAAQCVASPAQSLNNITTPATTVTCTGANTGQTVVVNTDQTTVRVNNAGSTLNNSTVTLNGPNNSFIVNAGASAANLVLATNGPSSNLQVYGSMTNLTANITGDSGGVLIDSGGTVTAGPGNIFLSAGAGQAQVFILQSGASLTSTGNVGVAYLLTGGTGDQTFDISGTVALQGNGRFINAGDGDDIIRINATAIFTNGNSVTHTIDGGSGNDRLVLNGSGNTPFFTIGVERLDVFAGNGGTRTLSENGSFNQVNLGSGTLAARRVEALGLANSVVTLVNGTTLSLDFTTPTTVMNSFAGTGTIRHNTADTVTYGGSSGGFSGVFNILGGTAVLTTSDAVGSGSIINGSILRFGDFNLANDISGTGRIIYAGVGTGDLSGNNTFSGGIDIQSGSLRVANVTALGTGAVTSSNGTILQVDNAGPQTLANDLTGNLILVKTNTGVLDLTGNNSYTGGTLIDAGGIRVDSFARLGTGPVIANANGSLILGYNGAGQLLQTTPFMTGAGVFIKEGTGDVVMSQTSTYTGGTIIRAGRIGLNNGDALGTGNIQVNAGAELGVGGIILNNSITGDGLVRKTASNLVEFYGNNSGFTGTIRVEDGLLFAVNGSALGSGVLQIDGGASVQVGAVNDSTVAADLAGGGTFEKLGGGSVTLTGDGSQFTGGIAVTGGTLQIEGSQNIGNTAGVFIASGATLQLDTVGNTNLFNAVFGDGNVVKTGTGTVFLTGANSYTGGTDIQQGAIRVTNVGALGTGPITVQAGAALDLSISGTATFGGAISGAGILRKSETGDLTLLNNTLTGGLDIVGGRVIVNTAAALGAGNVTTAADTQLVFTNSTTEVSNTLISGAGTLTMNGTGSLVINNANSYTGGTVINSGRIGLNNGQGLGTGTVLVLQNAILGIGNVLVANNVSGAGSIIKTASGVGMLTGTNTHSGGTLVQGGTLLVNSPAALGTGTVDISANAALGIDYSGTTNVAMNNLITGAGGLFKLGSGTVVINNANTFSGGTQIAAGTLGLNFGTGLGTGTITVDGGATLALGDITLANTVNGAGRITKSSAGTTTLTGTNMHTGGTVVQAGTLNVAGNAPLGNGTVTVGSGATLNFASTTPTTFANPLTGAGTFRNSGTGPLTFASNFTMGTLDLIAGRTRLNAVGTTNVTVGANATLDGTGRVIGNVANNGIVAPGNSIGTLTVQGNYVHNANAVLEIEFDGAGNIDLLAVTGSATLNGGILRFVSIGGAEGNGGTFLTATGGITGTFGTIETVGAQLPLAVVYEPNRALMAPSVLTARPSTFNAQTLAAADTAFGFIGTLTDSNAGAADGRRLWMNGFGSWNERSASGTTLGYSHESNGLAGGINLPVSERITFGAAIGWSSGDIRLGSNGGSGDQSTLLASAQIRHESANGTRVSGGILYGKVDQTTVRNVSFNGFSATVSGDTESTLFGGFAALQLPFHTSHQWEIGTDLRGSVIRQSQDGYTEGGASPLRLTVADIDTTTWQGEGRLYAETRLIDRTNGGEETSEMLTLRFDLGARYQNLAGDRAIPVTFAASNAGIVLSGDQRDGTQAFGGVALAYTTRGGLTASLGYEGETGRNDRHTVRAGISLPF